MSEPVWLSDNVLHVAPRADAWDESFLFHVLGHAGLERLATKTAQPLLTQTELGAVRVPKPSIPEQQSVARILDAIDEAIERTATAIAATESLRRALLHELLTRGVPGRHFEWTNVRGLGMVPRCWAVRTLGDILVLDQPGTWGSEPDSECAQPVVRAADFTAHGRLDIARAPLRNVPVPDRIRRLLADGDIVVERSGGGPGKPVGRVAVVYGLGRAYCSNFCQQLRVDESRCASSFAALTLEYRHRRGITLRMEQRTTGIRNLDYDAYRSFPFPVPPLEEQRLISEIIEAADERRLQLADTLDRLRVVKATIGDALLQGRIRVPARAS